MNRFLGTAIRRSVLRRGGLGILSGGKSNRLFAAISVAAAVLRLIQKLSGAGPKTLLNHKMKPGEVIVITEAKQPR